MYGGVLWALASHSVSPHDQRANPLQGPSGGGALPGALYGQRMHGRSRRGHSCAPESPLLIVAVGEASVRSVGDCGRDGQREVTQLTRPPGARHASTLDALAATAFEARVRRRRVRHPRPVHRALVRPRAILHRRPTVCCPGWCLPGCCRRQRDAPGLKRQRFSATSTASSVAAGAIDLLVSSAAAAC
jgi:hypothetical protein